jgi:hypothetical protein
MRKRVDSMIRLFLTIFLNTVLEAWGQIHWLFASWLLLYPNFYVHFNTFFHWLSSFSKAELRLKFECKYMRNFTLIVLKSRVYLSCFMNIQGKSRLCESTWNKVDSLGTTGFFTQLFLFWIQALLVDGTECPPLLFTHLWRSTVIPVAYIELGNERPGAGVGAEWVQPTAFSRPSWSRIHEHTISLRFLGIILRVRRLEVSVYNVALQTPVIIFICILGDSWFFFLILTRIRVLHYQ